jgi:SAM-dependent methyltransferase
MNPICGCENDPALNRMVISLPHLVVFECTGCGLWYTERLLKADAKEQLLHLHQSEWYAFSFPSSYIDSLPSNGEISRFRKAISLARTLFPDASSLIDIGCGGGRFLHYLVQSHEKWEKIVGVDVSPFLVRRAQAKNRNIVLADIQIAPFRNGCFDIATLWDVIEHLARPLDALKEIGRILSPKGVVILSTPNADSVLHSLSLVMFKSGIGLLQKPARRVFAGHPLYFTPRSLRCLLTRSGFVVQASWQYNVASEMSFRGRLLEEGGRIIDATLSKILKRQYRMVIVAQKGRQ